MHIFYEKERNKEQKLLARVQIIIYYTTYARTPFKIGPFGYTTVIVSLSTAITALSGAIFWHESLNAFKVIGIVLMLGCFALAVDTDNKDGKKANWTWFLFCIITLLTCAGIGLLQKVHQTSEYKNELMGFLIVAFVTSSIISLGGYFVFRKKENAIAKKNNEKVGFEFYFCIGYLRRWRCR